MAFPPERPLSDPLLDTPAVEPRRAAPVLIDAPERAPIGNSARTLALIVALIAVGIGVWWLRRPSDLTTELGSREWVILSVDDDPVVGDGGEAPMFVLDGTGEYRGMDGCNIVTGSWLYEPSSGQLVIEPESTSDRACSAEYPPTATPVSGKVALDGAELRLAGEEAEIVAVDTAALPMLEAGDLAGRWVAPEVAVEFGERGLLRVGDCTGSWSAVGGGISMQLDDGNGEACSAESMWTGGGTVIPARHDNTLLLRFDRPTFPLDRDIVRLELAEASGSPLLDGP